MRTLDPTADFSRGWSYLSAWVRGVIKPQIRHSNLSSLKTNRVYTIRCSRSGLNYQSPSPIPTFSPVSRTKVAFEKPLPAHGLEKVSSSSAPAADELRCLGCGPLSLRGSELQPPPESLRLFLLHVVLLECNFSAQQLAKP